MAPRAPERREHRDEYAAYLVVDHFGDLTLQHNDDSSASGQVDYLIMKGSDTVGALEIDRNTSRSRRRNVPRNTSFSAPTLDNSWDLTCSLDAAPTWNELKKKVIPVLQRMAIDGRTSAIMRAHRISRTGRYGVAVEVTRPRADAHRWQGGAGVGNRRRCLQLVAAQ